jgi:hypothetical protein
VKGVKRTIPKYGENSNSVSTIVNPTAADLVLKSMLDDALEIAQRRAKLVGMMKQALLADDMIALKKTAEIICGLREENQT